MLRLRCVIVGLAVCLAAPLQAAPPKPKAGTEEPLLIGGPEPAPRTKGKPKTEPLLIGADEKIPLKSKGKPKPPDKPAPAPADPATKPAESKETPKDPALARLLKSLDAALQASRKAGQEPDLTMTLLLGIARTSLVGVLHGHYAFAGLGHSLRTGGMPGAEVQSMASAMQQNYKMLTEAFALLAAQKSFDPELLDIFRSLRILAERGEKTAESLATYAAASSDSARMQAFDAALEDYRGRVHAFVTSLNR